MNCNIARAVEIIIAIIDMMMLVLEYLDVCLQSSSIFCRYNRSSSISFFCSSINCCCLFMNLDCFCMKSS